jgi:hypothetical protein
MNDDAGSGWSPEARVLLRPAAAFRELPRHGRGVALLLRRPLLLAFVLGCGVSALASGRFTARLILDGAVSFAFVPAIHLAAFGLVFRATAPRHLSFARAVDLFFTGHGAWLLWIVMVSAVGLAVPPRELGPWLLPLLAAALVPLAWSLRIDFVFFREVMKRTGRDALRDLLLQRAAGWIGVVLYFLGNTMWPLEQAFDL